MPAPIILIPARLAARRLPGKPLLELGGAAMIVHVWQRACAAALGPVVVATDSEAVAGAIETAGGKAVLTRADHLSGSDRIHEALQTIDPEGRFDPIVNLQGDLPLITPAALAAVLAPLAAAPEAEIATLATVMTRREERADPNVVKIVGTPLSPQRLRALYFTRAEAPWGEGPLYHHIGLYAYRRAALERFVALAPSSLEARERLEQLRALEAGMRIDVALVDEPVFGVDTPADLERARALLRPK